MNFPLTVELSTATLKLKPGASAEVSVTIRNVSPIVQHYEAMIVGLPSDDMWSRDVETTKLRPGEAGTIGVTIALPVDTQMLGGTYVLGVLVRSPYQPREVSRAEELTLTVETVAGITVTAFPEIVQGKNEGYFSVTVANTGNTAVALDIVATDDQGKASFALTPPGVALPAGGTQPVQVQIRSRGPFSGNERRSSVTVRALAGGELRGETKVTFVQQPRVAAAVLRVLGIVLAVAVVAAAIVVGGILGRSDPIVLPTPPPVVPTAVTTSASGAKPPAPPKIKLDPAQPVLGEPVTLSAQVEKGVTAYAWEITKPDGTTGFTSTQPELTPTFDVAGNYKVTLKITGADGVSIASATQSFSVKDKPPNVQVVTAELELPKDELVTQTLSCPEPKVAVGGGAYADQNDSQGLLYESSRPIEGGKGWSVAIRNTGNDVTATLAATCIEPFPGLQLKPIAETTATDIPRPWPASCDAGQVAIGGGGGFQPVEDDPEARAIITESAPTKNADDGSDTWWSVSGEATSPRILETLVWCAPEPAGFEVVVSPKAASGNGGLEHQATCTAGRQALSGGITFTEGAGAVQVDPARTMIMRASAPLSTRPGEMAQGWVAAATFTTNLDQALGVFVVCATLDQ